jgi:hypothetical protein
MNSARYNATCAPSGPKPHSATLASREDARFDAEAERRAVDESLQRLRAVGPHYRATERHSLTQIDTSALPNRELENLTYPVLD